MAGLTDVVQREFLQACEQISFGRLRLRTPDNKVMNFGTDGPEAEMHIHDWAAITAMAARGDVGMGETYVAGLWDTPSIETLTIVALKNMQTFEGFAYPSVWNRLKFVMVDKILRRNSKRGSAKNIKSHYDVGNEFYQLWLDPSMTYSSGIFEDGCDDLEDAQRRKYDRALSRLSAGERILEIGCGWGGFAERAADYGRHVTGLTISPSQHGYAQARLDGRAEIVLQDYRDERGRFDNIVSIEMIEAVGERYWPSYFSTVKQSLSESGKALIQAITVPDAYFPEYRRNSDYIRQYTFPGGMLLSNQAIKDQAQAAGLAVRDSFEFGASYAKTCRQWAERLSAQSPKIKDLGYDQPFLRNWQFYLEICAASFEVGQTNVVQVELAHA